MSLIWPLISCFVFIPSCQRHYSNVPKIPPRGEHSCEWTRLRVQDAQLPPRREPHKAGSHRNPSQSAGGPGAELPE